MNFIVNVGKGTIKAQGVKFSIDIPKDQASFWDDLEVKAAGAQYINALWFDSGKIHFGKYLPEIVDEENPENTQSAVQESSFYFDLSDYVLKSSSGAVMKPEVIVHDLRNLSVVPSEKFPGLKDFYFLWKGFAYPASSTRSKASYLFRLSNFQVRQLRAAEKLWRSGYIVNTNQMKDLTNNLRLEDVVSKSPWDLLEIPKCVYTSLVNDANLRAEFRWRSDFKTLQSFNFWGDLWPVLTQLNICSEFIHAFKHSTQVQDQLLDLIQNKSYDRTRLLQYLFLDLPEKQGFSDHTEAIRLLQDYASMSAAVEDGIPNKYPDYLKTEHDIMVVRFNKLKKDLQDAACVKAYEDRDYTYTSKEFEAVCADGEHRRLRIEVPRSAEDIAEEGKAMHHCVASYIPKVSKGETLILFMRTVRGYSYSYYNQINRQLTIELYKDTIVQARGKYNIDPTAIQFRFLDEYCAAMGFKLSDTLIRKYEEVVGIKYKSCKTEQENGKELTAC